MYAELLKSNTETNLETNSGSITETTQNFNWETLRKKMVAAIDANILEGKISQESKERWKTIRKQLNDDNINVANLFEQYDELFLLLKEVEGLSGLPNKIAITTKTKIYPNLSADKIYAAIGKEAVYVFLKEVSNKEIQGSAVNKGGVKVKNSEATFFIVGESLEFVLDEAFIKENRFEKENINWVVYKNKTDKGTVFVNEGTSFSYNFQEAGAYKVEAYGSKKGANKPISAKTSAFVELKIVLQEIAITPPANIKNGLTRATTEEQLFIVALKYPDVKTINPLQLYYQVENSNDKGATIITDQQLLDPTGIVKLTMPNLGNYIIKIYSKDQYTLVQESKISVIKNEVTTIGQAKDASNKGLFLLGDPNNTLTLEAKTFRINPATDEEKENVKWMVYDSNGKPYLPAGDVMHTENKDPQKIYLQKWNSFALSLPEKEGHFTVEAYSENKKGSKSESIFSIEMFHPQVTEAQWSYANGALKTLSGLAGEENLVTASIPGYVNQKVIIHFLVDGKPNATPYKTKTDEAGILKASIPFDDAFKKQLGITNKKNTKLQFILEGKINEKSYGLKKTTNKFQDTILINTEKKIIDAYFVYEGNRVTPFYPSALWGKSYWSSQDFKYGQPNSNDGGLPTGTSI
jgi:hypothetical protein